MYATRVRLLGCMPAGFAQKMHRTTLPERRREHLFDRTPQALMAIQRHILDPVQAAFLQLRQKRRPAGFGFTHVITVAPFATCARDLLQLCIDQVGGYWERDVSRSAIVFVN